MSDSPDRHLAWKVAGLGVAMFAFGFALVPLYDVFCAVTGYGGKTASAAVAVVENAGRDAGMDARGRATQEQLPIARGRATQGAVAEPDASRTVRVEFLASVASGSPFTLEPEVSHMEVHLGQLYETHFRARNLTGSPLAAQAVPSVAPGPAARYFNKAECFCFTSQQFAPHEELDLKLAFMVATELPAHVDTLSLSYTYFAASN